MAKITKDMTIAQVLMMDMDSAKVFLDAGMHCIGCPASSGESIEEAAAVHNLNADELLKSLNDFFESK